MYSAKTFDYKVHCTFCMLFVWQAKNSIHISSFASLNLGMLKFLMWKECLDLKRTLELWIMVLLVRTETYWVKGILYCICIGHWISYWHRLIYLWLMFASSCYLLWNCSAWCAPRTESVHRVCIFCWIINVCKMLCNGCTFTYQLLNGLIMELYIYVHIVVWNWYRLIYLILLLIIGCGRSHLKCWFWPGMWLSSKYIYMPFMSLCTVWWH